jgi:anti-sigma factor RsiW
MKDQEFIELLNLYLDHEISATDARRVEAEIQTNAERRKVYLEYCRMQKACGVLADRFVPERGAAEFQPARQRTTNRAVILAFGSLVAVAACVAWVLLFGGRRAIAPATPAETVASNAAKANPVASRPGVVIAAMSGADLRAPLARENATTVASDSLAWVRSFQVNAAPTLVEPARFEPAPDLFRHDLRAVPTGTTQNQAAESAAFRFQR